MSYLNCGYKISGPLTRDQDNVIGFLVVVFGFRMCYEYVHISQNAKLNKN